MTWSATWSTLRNRCLCRIVFGGNTLAGRTDGQECRSTINGSNYRFQQPSSFELMCWNLSNWRSSTRRWLRHPVIRWRVGWWASILRWIRVHRQWNSMWNQPSIYCMSLGFPEIPNKLLTKQKIWKCTTYYQPLKLPYWLKFSCFLVFIK